MEGFEYLIACSALSYHLRYEECRYLLECNRNCLVLYDTLENTFREYPNWTTSMIATTKSIFKEAGVELLEIQQDWLGFRFEQVINDKANTTIETNTFTIKGIEGTWSGVHDSILGYVTVGDLVVYGLLILSGSRYEIRARTVKYKDVWYGLKSSSRGWYWRLADIISYDSQIVRKYGCSCSVEPLVIEYLKKTEKPIRDVLDLDKMQIKYSIKLDGDKLTLALANDLDKSDLRTSLHIDTPDKLKLYILYHVYCKYVIHDVEESSTDVELDASGEQNGVKEEPAVLQTDQSTHTVTSTEEAQTDDFGKDAFVKDMMSYLSYHRLRGYKDISQAFADLLQAAEYKDCYKNLSDVIRLCLPEDNR